MFKHVQQHLFFHNGEQRREGFAAGGRGRWSCNIQQGWHLEIHADALVHPIENGDGYNPF